MIVKFISADGLESIETFSITYPPPEICRPIIHPLPGLMAHANALVGYSTCVRKYVYYKSEYSQYHKEQIFIYKETFDERC